MENIIKILIDLKKEMYRFDQAQQGDDVILDLTILDNGVFKDLTGATIELIYINANNTIASVTGENIIISGNNVKITCPRDCTRSYGISKFQLKITSQDKQVSTFPLALTIVQGVDQGQQISQNISTILEELTAMNIKSKETLESLNEWIETHGDMKEQLNNLKIGVRNLLSNGDFTKGLEGWTRGTGSIWRVITSTTTDQSKNYLETNKDSFGNSIAKFGFIGKGDYVTVSFQAKQVGSGIVDSKFIITTSGNTNPLIDLTSFDLSSEWKTYKFTLKAKVKGENTHGIYFYYGSGTDSLLINLTDIKIELGEKSTGFIPSTEDINEVIDLKANGGNMGTLTFNVTDPTVDLIKTSTQALTLQQKDLKGVVMEVDTLRPNSHALETMSLGTVTMPWYRLYAKDVIVGGTAYLRNTDATNDTLGTTKSNLNLTLNSGSGVLLNYAFSPNFYGSKTMSLGTKELPWGRIHGTSLELGGSCVVDTSLSNEDFVYTTKKQLSVHMGEGTGAKTGITLLEEILRPYAGSANKISLGINEAPWKDVFVARTSGEVKSMRERTKFFIVQVNGTTASSGNTSVPYPMSTTKQSCFMVGGYVIKGNGVANDIQSTPFYYQGSDMVFAAVEANRTYCLTFAILRE